MECQFFSFERTKIWVQILTIISVSAKSADVNWLEKISSLEPGNIVFRHKHRELQFLIQKQISKIHFLQIPNNILDLLLLSFDEQNDLTLLIDKISLFTPHHSKRMKKDKREKNDF